MFKGKYIQGMRDKPGPAAQRGINIHAKAEHYLNGNIRGLPPELKKLGKEYRNLKKTKPLVELKLAVSNKWTPVSWNKGWCRGILDVMTYEDPTCIIVDHKTGGVYDSHEEQGEIYACLAAANIDTDEYEVEFFYTDKGIIKSWSYTRKQVATLRNLWAARAEKMFAAKRFPETPSAQACKWCPVSSKRGGPCQGWKRI
jgi:hypothetical protein